MDRLTQVLLHQKFEQTIPLYIQIEEQRVKVQRIRKAWDGKGEYMHYRFFEVIVLDRRGISRVVELKINKKTLCWYIINIK